MAWVSIPWGNPHRVSSISNNYITSHEHYRFGHLLLVLVATIGRILVENKGEGLRYREFLGITQEDVIKEHCDGKCCILIGQKSC